MRLQLALAAVYLALAWLLLPGFVVGGNPEDPWRVKEIKRVRHQVHSCQDELGVGRSPIQYLYPQGRAFRAWVLRRWRHRERVWCGELRRLQGSPVAAIRAVFGQHGDEAVAVARCETGGTFSVWARNGQYLGLFQMGEYARARYGHSSTPLGQARAAHRYFLDAGWRPWECAYIVGIL